jgi:hypothetical protein
MVPGVWARAFSEAGGQLERARALYIKHRVAQLAHEASEKLKQERRATAEAARRRVVGGFRRLVCGLLATVFALIAAGFLVAGGAMPFETPRQPTSDLIGGIVGCLVGAIFFGFLTVVCVKASDDK